MTIKQRKTLQKAILAWYDANQREMPWRGETDPYKIWLSEVMLQQTQVTTVIPYYKRFLARFPSVNSLAEASLNEVLKYWEGLGYYARCRNLHKAAIEVVEKHNGLLPTTYDGLRSLPGFGEYTAGSVASIAFAQPVPAIDGNVKRVISRLFAIEDDITKKVGRNKIHEQATAFAEIAPYPPDWTQALMELGAMTCTPTRPKCLLCPAGHGLCRAQKQGLADSLPVKPRRKPIPHYNVAAGIIYQDENRTKFLIAQRPLDGMLGGLWEFPGGKQEPNETLQACLAREIKEELDLEIAVEEQIATVDHAFTHFKITLYAFSAVLVSGDPQKLGVADWAWVGLDQLDTYAFGRTDRKVIDVLHQERQS
ncbi:MAG: A/G-specific adenine glycosylase [Chloroflexota bacterium]